MAPVFPGISFLENQTPSLAFSCYVIYIVIKSEYFTKKSLDTFLVSLYHFTSTKKRGDTMAWNLNSDRPIFIQIVERIEMDIISGKYKPGDKLPSVRDLAAEAAVNPNTMQKAFTELERTGLVFSQRTTGRFITEDTSMIDELKSTLAKDKITELLSFMQQLGFQENEILTMIGQTMKGEK